MKTPLHTSFSIVAPQPAIFKCRSTAFGGVWTLLVRNGTTIQYTDACIKGPQQSLKELNTGKSFLLLDFDIKWTDGQMDGWLNELGKNPKLQTLDLWVLSVCCLISN